MNTPSNDDNLIHQVQTLRLRLRAANRALRKARALSECDALTGLPNRRFLETEIRRCLHRAQRYNHPMALLLLDLDQFKQVNDADGHAVGDALLCDFAKFLASQTRGGDVVGRWGGDEFVIVLPHAVAEIQLTETGTTTQATTAAQGLARRIAKALAQHDFTIGTRPIKLTISQGIAVAKPTLNEAIDPVALFTRADEALYEAKRAGGHTFRPA